MREKEKASYKMLSTKGVYDRASKVFANGPGDWGSIPGRVTPKTKKMVLDTALLNTQHYKVRIKDKEEKSKEWSSGPPYTEKGRFRITLDYGRQLLYIGFAIK